MVERDSANPADDLVPATPVKVVVWDLDRTVWPEVAVELPNGERPTPRADVLAAMRTLAAAGVVNAVASRTDPAIAAVLEDSEIAPLLVSAQLGWHDKSRSLTLIADELGVAVDSLVLVDDSEFERAEVEHALPGVRTWEPERFLAELDSVLPALVSSEAGSRTDRYRAERERRRAATGFADDRSFLDSIGLRLTVGPMQDADRVRVLELAHRAHRLSSTQLDLDEQTLADWEAADGHEVVVGRLQDRFGEYGLIALALVSTTGADDGRTPTDATDDTTAAGQGIEIPLLAVSCRVAGRGAPGAFLAELLRRAEPGPVVVPIRATTANVELRLLVRSLGFELSRVGSADAAEARVRAVRTCTAPVASPWIEVVSDG